MASSSCLRIASVLPLHQNDPPASRSHILAARTSRTPSAARMEVAPADGFAPEAGAHRCRRIRHSVRGPLVLSSGQGRAHSKKYSARHLAPMNPLPSTMPVEVTPLIPQIFAPISRRKQRCLIKLLWAVRAMEENHVLFAHMYLLALLLVHTR